MTSKSNTRPVRVQSWLADSLENEAKTNIARLARATGVKRMAIMPDVHLASKACVGTVVATQGVVYPEIVGSDIGCGISTVFLNCEVDRILKTEVATGLLDMLKIQVPAHRQRAENCIANIPQSLMGLPLSDARLEKMKSREARVQLGTLGRGNHFLEFQSDQEGGLWLMVHSGSRGMGQAIFQWHLSQAEKKSRGLVYLDEDSKAGQAYLADVAWAVEYARLNRLRMIENAVSLLAHEGALIDFQSLIDSDHNHVRRENHFGELHWVHRKGAQSAGKGESGLVPGSMGAESFHVTGRACADALRSCSHGAGRRLRRKVAAVTISRDSLEKQMNGVWFDQRNSFHLVQEAPSAYRNIRAVMRAQRKLVRIERVLNPVLSYKGR